MVNKRLCSNCGKVSVRAVAIRPAGRIGADCNMGSYLTTVLAILKMDDSSCSICLGLCSWRIRIWR